MGDKPKYRVVELSDPRQPDLPRAVFACRADASPWRAAWQHRNELQSKLSAWFRELSEAKTEPLETVLLGRAGVHENTARAVVRFRLEQIARMAGCPAGEWPDFLAMDKPANIGQKGVPVYADGVVYPSRAAAARAAGITRRAVWERMQRAGGWNWL